MTKLEGGGSQILATCPLHGIRLKKGLGGPVKPCGGPLRLQSDLKMGLSIHLVSYFD